MQIGSMRVDSPTSSVSSKISFAQRWAPRSESLPSDTALEPKNGSDHARPITAPYGSPSNGTTLGNHSDQRATATQLLGSSPSPKGDLQSHPLRGEISWRPGETLQIGGATFWHARCHQRVYVLLTLRPMVNTPPCGLPWLPEEPLRQSECPQWANVNFGFIWRTLLVKGVGSQQRLGRNHASFSNPPVWTHSPPLSNPS